MSRKLTITILGGSGFLGGVLGGYLAQQGHALRVVSRRPDSVRGTLGFPATIFAMDGRSIPAAAVAGCDVVINLAGAGINDARWRPHYREKLIKSRVATAQALAAALQGAGHRPSLLLQASAIGYYGQDTTGEVAETAAGGSDFLAEVCRKWEAASAPLAHLVERMVTMRIGVVMDFAGGALSALLKVYSAGTGAVLGHGRQWLNWIHSRDICGFAERAIADETYTGVYNLVAPGNVTNRQMHAAFAEYFPRVSPLPVPAAALKLALGARATLVLDGPRVVTSRQDPAAFQVASFEDLLAAVFGQRQYPQAVVIKQEQWLPISVAAAWEFLANPKNLEALTAPKMALRWQGQSTEAIAPGTEITYKVKVLGVPTYYCARIAAVTPGEGFVDCQAHGPFKLWHHRHLVAPLGSGSVMADFVEYLPPMWPLSLPAWPMVHSQVAAVFAYRRQQLARLFAAS